MKNGHARFPSGIPMNVAIESLVLLTPAVRPRSAIQPRTTRAVASAVAPCRSDKLVKSSSLLITSTDPCGTDPVPVSSGPWLACPRQRIGIAFNMRLVLDTNIIIGAFRSPRGGSAALVQAVRYGRVSMLVTPPLFFEYEQVVARPEHLRAAGATISRGRCVSRCPGGHLVPRQSPLPVEAATD